jgi:hypothetical protein
MIRTRPIHRFAATLSTLTLCVGCAFEQAEPPEDYGQDVYASSDENGVDINGKDINGKDINGKDINGKDINGKDINGKDINGKDINGKDINGLSLDGSMLVAERPKGGDLEGEELIGIVLQAELTNGTPISLRVDNVELEPSFYDDDYVHMYTVSFKYPGGTTWKPVCGTSNGEPVRAVPLRGRWDYRQGVPGGGDKINDWNAITFACEGYTLEKCVGLGYEPWRKVKGKKLNKYHQACVRLHRADYCGDGRSFTKDGTVINLYDNLDIQEDTENWTFEAEWDDDGARCLKKQRISGAQYKPNCGFDLSAQICGKAINWKKTYLANEH